MSDKAIVINEPKYEWGGPWTEKKLEAFSKYVMSYLTIMRRNPYWKTIYFDGFAGSGTRDVKVNTDIMSQLSLRKDEEYVYKGAAERVLGLKDNNSNDMNFDYYYFIDKKQESLDKLKEKLGGRFDNNTIEYRAGDANEQLEMLAGALETQKLAALVFLDPFGMQINWDSIAKLKGTRSDLWILVPTGVIVNRLLDTKGELKHSEKLESFFGLSKDEIYQRFYKVTSHQTLFGEESLVEKVSKPIEEISKLYAERLGTIWKHVTKRPLVLTNTRGCPIFHFVFASNNKYALKIANDIIGKI